MRFRHHLAVFLLLALLCLLCQPWTGQVEARPARRRSRSKRGSSRGSSTSSSSSGAGSSEGKSCQSAEDCSSGELCAYGKCTCPILYKGSGCRTVKPTRGKWCVTPFSGFRSSGYHPDLNFTTCAVVGNSDSLKKQEWGEEINAHSVVIRFNEAPTVGFKKYAGDWHPGTIRIQNKERGGFAERSGEKCLVWPNNVYQRRRSNKRCQVTRMKSSFANYGKKYWKDHSPPGGSPSSGNKAKVSNGFLGVLLALHKCAQVDIYGFSQGRGHYFKKFTGRAKGWGNPNKPIVMNSRPHNRRHSWTAERACIKRLNDEIPEFKVH